MLKKIRKNQTIKYWKSNISGTTLVELVVTFALMGIFIIAATFVITSSVRLFYQMRSVADSAIVSDLILEKVVGEISAADVEQEGKSSGYCFWLGDKNQGEDWIAFCNRSGSPVSIFAQDGRLVVRYYEDTEESITENLAVEPAWEMDWSFDDNVYMGYEITELKFSQPQPSSHPNVIRVDLTMKNTRTGYEYTTHRYARNYNYDVEEIN